MESIRPVNLLDRKYDFNTEAKVGSVVGNEAISTLKFQPLNNQNITGNSLASQTFQITSEAFFDSDVRMEASLTIPFTLTDANGAVALDTATLQGQLLNNFGVASFPLNRCIETATVRLNNSSQYTTQVANVLDEFLYSKDPNFLATLSPASKLDNYRYFDNTKLSNVLRDGSNTIDTIDSRGLNGNYRVEFNQVSPEQVNMVITLQECILARPFQYHTSNPHPFFNINDLYMVLNYRDLANFYKINTGAMNFGAGNTLGVGAPVLYTQLIIRSYSPMVQVAKPALTYYNSPIVNKYVGATQTLAQGASTQYQFLNYVVNGIPKMFVLYASAPELQNAGHSFATITQVSVSFDNKVNLLLDLNTPEDLYELSSKNGYNQRYGVWNTGAMSPMYNPAGGVPALGCGSIFMFKPEDLALNQGQQSNTAGSYNINIKLTIQNNFDSQLTFSPVLSMVYDNVLTYSNGAFQDYLPLLNPSQVVSAPMEYKSEDKAEYNHILGGAWSWGDIWSGVKKFAKSDLAKDISKTARNLDPIKGYVGDDTAVGKLAKKYGYGKKGKTMGGSSVAIGGKKVSKGELLKML